MLFLAWIAGTALSQAAPLAPVTLSQAYQSALKNTQTLSIEVARTTQASERIAQARSEIFPKLNAVGDYTKIDRPSSSLVDPTQKSARLNLTQPLFHGLREFAALRAAKATLASQKALEEHAKLTLYSSVGVTYYSVLLTEQDLSDLQMLLELTEKRVKELKGRANIGRSRRSELLSAQSQAATLRAQVQAAELAAIQAKEDFRLATGLNEPWSLEKPAQEIPGDGTGSLKPMNEFLSQIESRPDIEALKQRSLAAMELKSVARGSYLPNLDLGANYYLYREGTLKDSKWDLGLTLTVPLFQGGLIRAQVAEAEAVVQEQELLLEQARRIAEREIRLAHQTLQSAISQISILNEGLQIAEKNYEEQSRDYRYGLSTNLDVIQALNAFQEAKRAFDRTRYQAQAAWVTLQASVGKLP